jgi:hypothetical protein
MIKITENDRVSRYRKADELIRTLYAGDTVSEVLTNKYPDYDTLITYQVIGDTILGFYKTAELPGLLQKEIGVSADDAQRIVSDLAEFLGPVIAREKAEANANQAELQELQQTFSPAQKVGAGTVPTAPTPTEVAVSEDATAPTPQEAHTPVQAMRTMEGDMGRIHGYGAYRAQFPEEPQEADHTEEVIRSASQEEILQEKPKLAGMPTYEEKE